MVNILVDQLTKRIEYSFYFIFEVRGVEFYCTSSPEEYTKLDGPKLNYSSHVDLDGVRIKPSSLLYSKEIYDGVITKSDKDILCFDGHEDPVASVFYLLSRMEEYGAKELDKHGRFPFEQSILCKFYWMEKAMCDRWAKYILYDLLDLEIKRDESCQIIPSFDIDNTYAYKLKKGKRRLLSTARDIAKLDRKRLKERIEVKYGGIDPYDTFDKILQISETHENTLMFWLLKSNGDYDRNIDIEDADHQVLIKCMARKVDVNIHPSYASFKKKEDVLHERKTLESLIKKDVLKSRQHFLRFQLPRSYRCLIEAGIEHDYSMGFAEQVGFRAGTARPHLWYDISNEEITSLRVHPFVYMDGSLLEYMGLNVDEAKQVIEGLYEEVQKYGGDFVFIWHNETIGDYGKWKGWSEVLEFTLKLN